MKVPSQHVSGVRLCIVYPLDCAMVPKERGSIFPRRDTISLWATEIGCEKTLSKGKPAYQETTQSSDLEICL